MIFLKKCNIVLSTFWLVFSLGIPCSNVHAQTLEESKTTSSSETLTSVGKLTQSQLLDLFLIEIGLRKNLSISTLREVFADVVPQVTAKKYIAPSTSLSTKKNWLKYRQNAQDPSRVMAGQKFWLAYDKQCFKLCNSFILQ
jgi:membrane-bound lytic murein transglycosylase B